MDMRLPAGLQAAAAPQVAPADAPPPLRLLQRWRPAAALQVEARPAARRSPMPAAPRPGWRLKLQQLFRAA